MRRARPGSWMSDSVGRVDGATARRPADPLGGFGQRLGDPFAYVAFPPGTCRAEQVQADAAGDLRQPGAGGFDGFLLLSGHGVPAGVGLLDGVLSIGQGAQQPVGEIEQLTPLADDRAQARLAPVPSWLGLGGHVLVAPLVVSALTSSTRHSTGL